MITLAIIAAWLLLTFMLWASSAHFDRSLLPHCFLVSTLVTALGFTLMTAAIYWEWFV